MRRAAIAARMPRLAAVLLVLALLAPAPLQGDTAAGHPFAGCETRLAADPGGWAPYCFVAVAREHRLWTEARRRVAAHRARRPADPFLRFTLAVLELEGGELPVAAEHFRGAAEAFARRGAPHGEALAWMNLAECLMRRGSLEETQRALGRAAQAARAAADTDLRVMVRVRQSELERQRGGDLQREAAVLLRLERDLAADADYQTRKLLLYERAVLAHRLGRYDEARRINGRWAELARGAGALRDEATALSNMVLDLTALPSRPGAREEAVRRARAALEAAERVGNRPAEITAHRLLGKLLPGEPGRRHLEECLRLTGAAGETLQRAACLFALAGSLAAPPSADEPGPDPARAARATLDEALALAVTSEDPWTAAYGWAEQFRVSWATLSRRDAAAASLALVDHVEALRRLQSSESGRAGFFTDWAEVYHSLAGFLLAAPDGPSREELETAFAVAERLRARVLLDGLAAAGVEVPATARRGLAAERAALLHGIADRRRRLLDPRLAEAPRTRLLAELDDLERALVEPEAGPDAPAAAFPAHGFVALPAVEAELGPDEALLAFLVAADEDVYGKFAGGSWLLAVSSSGTRAYRLPPRMELEVKVQTFVGLVEGRRAEDLVFGAATLYDDLLGAAVADLPARVEELILVPDGVLHLLPFGLLRPHPQADPLAVSHRLSAAPSVTLWHGWRRRGPPASLAALALADPAFVGAGTGVDGRPGRPAAADRRGSLETHGRLGRLPHAAREGRALVRRLGGPPSRVLVGEEASEAFLKRTPLDGFGVLHLAAHTLMDERRPRRSAVLLAAGGGREDGLLQPHEIAALDLTGKLVVVSGCESGSGRLLLGEGVQSLARTFFRAGARAVVASLWRLEDDEAAAFFDLFYRALADGESVAGAVAEAGRELRSAGAPAAAWAGVVVLGDGGMVPLPGGAARAPWWRLGWVVPAAVALFWSWRRRGRARALRPDPA